MSLVRYRDVPWAAFRERRSTGKRPIIRFWDLASAKPSKTNPDPDWTAGALLGAHAGEWYLLDVRRSRLTPKGVEDLLWRTHELDDEWLEVPVPVRVEQEGGSGGSITIDQFARNRFVGVDFKGQRPEGSKIDRATPVSVAAETGRFHLLEGQWVEDFLLEAEVFPDGVHDDQIDAVSGAFTELRPILREPDLPAGVVSLDRAAPRPD